MINVKNSVANVLSLLDRVPLSIVQLMARVGVGGVYFSAGLDKIASWQPTVALFANEYRVPLLPPEFAAQMAASIELTCPILLFVGFGSRLATLPMLAQAFVIETFVYPADWIEHLGWATMLGLILIRGPGVVSVDYWIKRWAYRQPMMR